jgi:PAS domain S-box-containing protein
MALKLIDRSKLSSREDEVLALAIDGATDQQIALHLNISVSTVNSYWTRIRGKLGRLSRTELVASALKVEAQSHIAYILEQNREERRNTGMSGWTKRCPAAFDAIPEAVFVIGAGGEIQYANTHLEELLGYKPGELIGRVFNSLVPVRLWATFEEVVLKSQKGSSIRLGVDDVFYINQKDGAELRVILLLGSDNSFGEPILSGIVRGFLDEIDTRRRSADALVRGI